MFLLSSDKLPAELRPHLKRCSLITGERLYNSGDRANAIFAVKTGRVHLQCQSADGRATTIDVIRAGECVWEASLFTDYYCADAVAETDTQVVVFPKAHLIETLRRRSDLCFEFMTMLAARVNSLKTRLELRSLLSARERVIQYLLLTRSPGTDEVFFDRPLSQIAEDLGLARESLYRLLAQLQKDGSITRRDSSILLNRIGNAVAKVAVR